jgi:chromosome segregation ATPase
VPDRIEIPCPGCQRALNVREQYVGRMIQCKHCGERFVARSKHKEEPHVIPWPEVALKALGVGSEELMNVSPANEASVGRDELSSDAEATRRDARAETDAPSREAPTSLGTARPPHVTSEVEHARLAAELATISRSLHAQTIEMEQRRIRHAAELEALGRERAAQAESLTAALAERDRVKSEFEQLTIQVDAQQAQKASDHGQFLAAKEAELAGAQAELALLAGRLELKNADEAEHGRLLSSKQAELDGLRAELALLTTQIEAWREGESHHESSVSAVQTELEAVRAELARLSAVHESVRAASEENARRIETEAETRIAEAIEASERRHLSERESWDAEKTHLAARVSELEEASRAEAARNTADQQRRVELESERDAAQESLATIQTRFDLEREERSAEASAMQRDKESAIADRDIARRGLEAARAEFEASGATRSELERTAKMAEDRLRAEVDRLARERDEALTRAATLARQLEGHEDELGELRRELEETRASGEFERSRWETERTLLARAGERSRQSVREGSNRQLLEAQTSDPHLDDIADLFAAGLVADLSGAAETPDHHKGADHLLDDKQRRINELSAALEDARADAAQLRSTLTSLGIRFY